MPNLVRRIVRRASPKVVTAVVLAVALTVISVAAGSGPALAQSDAGFRDWLTARVWPDARAQGVSQATFAAATAGLSPDWKLPDLGKPGQPPKINWQSEFSAPGRYLSEDKIAPLVSIGRAQMKQWASVLAAIEKRYGVPKEIVVAIWGRESAFGRAAIPKSAIRTLATQAYAGTRRDLFYPELIAALKILEGDHIPLAEMKSSIAGALGQPQFLPSKYLAYAVDFDGDGRRDIWQSVPDTLASIANYLKQHGWQSGRHWGHEARVPDTVNCAVEGPEQPYPLTDWTKAGVTRADGAALPGSGGDKRHLMMPAGRLGPAFIVSWNFYVLKEYNESDLYALFVGHVSDRLSGAPPIAGKWNTVAGFRRGDVRAMQERLVAKGYDVGGADGLVGFKTRTAIGLWQRQNGLAPTCFPDAGLIGAIR
ncbi:lytic murein transglycosylase [Microbaculum marinisediminis]|uniref:Lytic murein transglycosylase n=1 Tax=Microbaculum marinisediminis TaxID=2931392 RepID=A0AAW5R1S9_9HYPH|nr:lytic murein transglycosylase [Microbaculum sp. A6E488]MCT8973297.1 lytic murein transglycosylase [Microbaculum sp. A6E488]